MIKFIPNLEILQEREGFSLNSIVKDAVDKWIENNSQTVKKHELVLYADDESLKNFLKSIDRISHNDDFLKACCGPKSHLGMEFLTKHGWVNGTSRTIQTISGQSKLLWKKSNTENWWTYS